MAVIDDFSYFFNYRSSSFVMEPRWLMLGEFNSLIKPRNWHKNGQQKTTSGLLLPSWKHTVLNSANLKTVAIHS